MTRTDSSAASVVRTVRELKQAIADARKRGEQIALVPTMGALHKGHLSLIRQARAECDFVVMSLFVNPTQFNEQRDLDAYPRTEASDVAMAASAGCTIVFAPTVSEVYPIGFDTTVEVGRVASVLEGAARGPVHFRGVATVVSKLFNMVAPDVAYFGQKDAQQALVIQQMARDLDFPVTIRVCPIVRDADGLALSSRNVRLSPEARSIALGIVDALHLAEIAFANGERDAARLVELAVSRLESGGIARSDIDYVAINDATTLEEVPTIDRKALLAIAAYVGGVRLIDNTILTP
jgi:pantoate--beta-alanine ligase